MKKNKKSKLILVGKNFVGLAGLNEIFQNLFDDGKEPDGFLKNELLSLVKKKICIPSQVEEEYSALCGCYHPQQVLRGG